MHFTFVLLPILLCLNFCIESAHGLPTSRHAYSDPLMSSLATSDSSMIIASQTDPSRRIVLQTMFSILVVPKPALSSTTILPLDSLDSVDWSKPKARGLNTERMADGINDSIKENAWLVTGLGQPEYFSDSYIFHSEEENISIDGYKQYCYQWVHHRYRNPAHCDLICCSVSAPNTINALWRIDGKQSNKDTSKVMQSTFTTDEDDGLVVSQLDKVIIDENAPSADHLRARCNWYSCTLEDII